MVRHDRANLVPGEPLLTIRMVGGRPVLDVPAQESASARHVRLLPQGAATAGGPWSLPLQPAPDTTGKPSHRAWFAPEGAPASAFFRLVVEPVD